MLHGDIITWCILLQLAIFSTALDHAYDEFLWTKSLWSDWKVDNPFVDINPTDEQNIPKSQQFVKNSILNSLDGPWTRRLSPGELHEPVFLPRPSSASGRVMMTFDDDKTIMGERGVADYDNIWASGRQYYSFVFNGPFNNGQPGAYILDQPAFGFPVCASPPYCLYNGWGSQVPCNVSMTLQHASHFELHSAMMTVWLPGRDAVTLQLVGVKMDGTEVKHSVTFSQHMSPAKVVAPDTFTELRALIVVARNFIWWMDDIDVTVHPLMEVIQAQQSTTEVVGNATGSAVNVDSASEDSSVSSETRSQTGTTAQDSTLDTSSSAPRGGDEQKGVLEAGQRGAEDDVLQPDSIEDVGGMPQEADNRKRKQEEGADVAKQAAGESGQGVGTEAVLESSGSDGAKAGT